VFSVVEVIQRGDNMFGRRVVALGAVAMWTVAVGFGVSAAAQQQTADRKIWDGVYTPAQAARGKPKFEMSCGRCHNNELVGSERGPTLKGNGFWNKYENDSLGSLFTFLRDMMPRDGAGLVSDEVKVDILAYILSRNDVPAGADELKLAASALEAIKITKKGVLDGVYTAAQAERGKANFLSGRCGGCHQLDLSGDRGPALKGDSFLSHWENGSVNALFKKISETMPPNSPNETSDEAKVDIVAYLLQSNAFPAGKSELTLDADALEAIEIARKSLAAAAPNFSLVQVVGCLTQAPNSGWTLTRTSEPVVTRQEQPSASGLKEAEARPLGGQTWQLVSATPFKPEAHNGQKMEARGLIYKDARDAMLNLTSLQMVAASCAN
jgi:S-disulfanyl-L-cysteine oxidoreductase SoxD